MQRRPIRSGGDSLEFWLCDPADQQLRAHNPCFEVQQKSFPLQAAGIAHQLAIRPDHPVARHYHTERIARICAPDLTRERDVAELAGELAIGSRLSVGDVSQQVPNAQLEGTPTGGDAYALGSRLPQERRHGQRA